MGTERKIGLTNLQTWEERFVTDMTVAASVVGLDRETLAGRLEGAGKTYVGPWYVRYIEVERSRRGRK